MAKTPDDMMSAVSGSLAERTGRTLDEWVALVQASGIDPLDQNAVRRWLRSAHGVPQNSQWVIADAAARAAGWVRPSTAEYIDSQYTGAKAALRPIYDKFAAAIEGLGDDVTVEGRGGYTPFVRGRQFAAVAAATRDRVDLGLRFADVQVADELIVCCEVLEHLVDAEGALDVVAGLARPWAILSVPREPLWRALNLLRLAYEQSP